MYKGRTYASERGERGGPEPAPRLTYSGGNEPAPRLTYEGQHRWPEGRTNLGAVGGELEVDVMERDSEMGGRLVLMRARAHCWASTLSCLLAGSSAAIIWGLRIMRLGRVCVVLPAVAGVGSAHFTGCGGMAAGPSDVVDGGERDATGGSDSAPSNCGYDDAVDSGRPSTTPPRPDSELFDGVLDIYTSSAGCPMLEQTAPYIRPVPRGNQPLPPPLGGGTIRDGRYELVLVEVSDQSYADVKDTFFRRTVEFGGCGSRWILSTLVPFAGENYVQVTDRAPLTTEGSTLTAHYDNPCWLDRGDVTYLYEATADTVVTWFEEAGTLLTYLRVR
jgi:hypothetical protein